jgi:hypothetical protein
MASEPGTAPRFVPDRARHTRDAIPFGRGRAAGQGGQSGPSQPLAPGDENWDNRFTLPNGMNNTPFAAAVSNTGDVYVGGFFTSAGGVAANYIARWNGTEWSSLGSGVGLGGDSTYVVALALACKLGNKVAPFLDVC